MTHLIHVRKIRCLFCLLLISFLSPLLSLNAYAQQPQTPTIKVAVLAPRGNGDAIQRWQPTIDWLNIQLPQYQFELLPSNLEQLEQAVREDTVEFAITNPGQSVMLGQQFPLSWIATLNSPWPHGTSQALGSALVVRVNSPFVSLNDLQHSHAVAVSPDAFGGFLTLKQYLKSQQQDPQNFFQHIDYIGFPLDAMIYQLRDNRADVAITPACLLENMAKDGLIDAEKFRVINNTPPPGFPCSVSTPLYPNWSFAKTSKASEGLATNVAKALLSLPADSIAATAAQSKGWASPISPLRINKLYQDLNIHPLQTPWWQQALLWLKQNQQWAWAALILFLALSGYHFWLEYRFNRNQKLLNLANYDLKQKSQMLEHAQRVAIVGGLGSNLAHEINQPLAAIRNYNQGAIIKISKGAKAEDLTPIMEKIEQQVVRVDAIVQRLRNLITKRPIATRDFNIQAIIDDTIALLKHDLSLKHVNIHTQIIGRARDVHLDPVGIQQVLINLLNNATDSCLSHGDPLDNHIKIVVEYLANEAHIIITDNGAGLSHPIEHLQAAFVTTKEEGLGLGLSICHDIIEHHRGHFTLQSIQPHGCEARIQLPYSSLTQPSNTPLY